MSCSSGALELHLVPVIHPVRVLRCITRLNIGGPALQALMLAKDLANEFPTLLAAGQSPPEEGELSDPDVPVTRVSLVRAVRPVLDVAAFRAIGRLMDSSKPALIHTHMAKAGALGRLAAFRSPLKPVTVHTFHGHVLDGYFGAISRHAFIQIEKQLARRTHALIAVSSEIRDELLDLGIGTPERWHVIPLGFDLDPFARVDARSGVLREELGLAEDIAVVGVLGRLAPVKDHALLLEAIARLPDVHLVVLGDGELRGRLEDRAAERDLAGRVHFLGWRRDVPEALADIDVVALTSVSEGTPVTLIEALAAARPVVATDVGGVRSVVRDGVDGLLVQSRVPEDIAAALARLLSDGSLRTAFGDAGRARVLVSFEKGRLLSDVRTLYRQLLGS